MERDARDRISVGARYRYPSPHAKRLIEELFSSSIRTGRIGLQFADEIVEVGSGAYICTIAPPTLSRLLTMLAKPDYRLPEYFTRGYWCCEPGKLYDFLELLTSQDHLPLQWWFRLFCVNPIRDRIVYRLFPIKVKENIAHHYNTSPNFMRLILGDNLEYTCAFFDEDHASLDSAQQNKIELAISRLQLKTEHRVLDLGCGWGGIAAVVTRSTGARVTAINISPGQIEYANANLASERLSFQLTDYEAFSPTEKFHRIYSIGMLEHIGLGLLDKYFGKVAELLDSNGVALIHCIVRRHHESTNSWIDSEVFPGAYIPQLSEIIEYIERSELKVAAIYAHGSSNYFRTLSAWTENFCNNKQSLEEVLSKALDPEDVQTIMRMWEFYLCGSRLAFNESGGDCYNVQVLLKHQR